MHACAYRYKPCAWRVARWLVGAPLRVQRRAGTTGRQDGCTFAGGGSMHGDAGTRPCRREGMPKPPPLCAWCVPGSPDVHVSPQPLAQEGACRRQPIPPPAGQQGER